MSGLTKVNGFIDVHSHFTPPISDEERIKKWHAMRAEKFMVPEPFQWDPESVISYMDQQGVQMQMLSNIPKTLDALKASNDYAHSLQQKYPSRFGYLAALPTDDTQEALNEARRATSEHSADGFAVTTCYNGVYLGDRKLDRLWEELNNRPGTVVFCHPDAYAPASLGRPSPLIEVAFDTARTVVDMLYAGFFRRYPSITFIISHCGGALPALSGRIFALGTEAWVPNDERISVTEMKEQLANLYVDCAATATASTLLPALELTGKQGQHMVYGSDCGVPCSNVRTLDANVKSFLDFDGMTLEEKNAIGWRAKTLFPSIVDRIDQQG